MAMNSPPCVDLKGVWVYDSQKEEEGGREQEEEEGKSMPSTQPSRASFIIEYLVSVSGYT